MNSFLAILATAEAAQEAAPNNNMFIILQFVALGAIFYFLLIRPQRQRQKQHAALVSAVKTGDKVVLNSGLHGIVANVKETTIIVKVADNVKLEFDKSAVAAVTKSDE